MKYNLFMGEYDDNTIYQAGDVVNFDGASYYRKVPGKGISPIARKKPYTVWSRLNEALSTIFPLGGTGGGGASLPTAAPYQQLVTDGEGKWVPVDRLAWKEVALGEPLGGSDNMEWEENEGLYSSPSIPTLSSDLVDGQKYCVTADGVQTFVEAKTVQGFAYLGNAALMGFGADTGETFIVVDYRKYASSYMVLSEVQYKAFFILPVLENIHTIPLEYLPKTQMVTFTKDGSLEDITCSLSGAELFSLMLGDKFAGTSFVYSAAGYELHCVSKWAEYSGTSGLMTGRFGFLKVDSDVGYGLFAVEIKVEIDFNNDYSITITEKNGGIPKAT